MSRFMSLGRKFGILLVLSITAIAILNIIAFYVFYNSYIRLYLSDKINERQDVTIEYINNIIERQALENIDSIFDDVELEFFELLDISEGSISLQEEENVNIVVEYLRKSNVSPKYIEEIIPENNLEKVLESLRESDSPESKFISRLLTSIITTNLFILLVFALGITYLTGRIMRPIQGATRQISSLELGRQAVSIPYHSKDEIGLLIDAINKLNNRLSVQEKIRSRLLADISHELKTPITSIQCYLEGISDGVIQLSEKNLDSIISEMTRLTSLVNKIMEYEKFENTKLTPQKQSYSPYSIIRNVIATQEAYLSEGSQTIELQGSENIELILDPDLFTQLVYNIIGNFIKYAGANTKLIIHVKPDTIVFQDNGAGIASKEIPFLFEKFYQGKKEKSGDISDRGIGVGLSIVQKIVQAHGWRYKVESDSNAGFTFTLFT